MFGLYVYICVSTGADLGKISEWGPIQLVLGEGTIVLTLPK